MNGQRLLTAALLLAALLATQHRARADLFLVGAQLYRTDSVGQNVADPYQYSTNSATSHFPLPINGGTGLGISFSLADGDNVFTFAPLPGQSVDPGSFAGLNLFFNTTGTSFNPPAGSVVPGDLTVFSTTDGLPLFSVTGAGTSILSYGSSGFTPTIASANGLASLTLDGRVFSVTAFAVNRIPSGSFTIRVGPSALPEPASVVMLGIGAVGLIGYGWRRRTGLLCIGLASVRRCKGMPPRAG